MISAVNLTLISLNTKDPHSAATRPYPYREETKQFLKVLERSILKSRTLLQFYLFILYINFFFFTFTGKHKSTQEPKMNQCVNVTVAALVNFWPFVLTAFVTSTKDEKKDREVEDIWDSLF